MVGVHRHWRGGTRKGKQTGGEQEGRQAYNEIRVALQRPLALGHIFVGPDHRAGAEILVRRLVLAMVDALVDGRVGASHAVDIIHRLVEVVDVHAVRVAGPIPDSTQHMEKHASGTSGGEVRKRRVEKRNNNAQRATDQYPT